MPTLRSRVLANLRLGFVVLGLGLCLGSVLPAEGAERRPSPLTNLSDEELSAFRPQWPNPYLSFLPAEARPDWDYWQEVMGRQAHTRSRGGFDLGVSTVSEAEPNDTAATAQFLSDFGSGAGEENAVDVLGSFGVGAAPTVLGPFAEDDGSIPLATDTGLIPGSAVRISGIIGDGPFGSAGTGSGDFDVFRIPGVTVGQLIVIDLDTPVPMGDLDPFIALYDSTGMILALNEDGDASTSFDSFLAIPATVAGDYFLAVAGSLFPFASLLGDPFDSSSGPGVGSEGEYTVTIALEDGDQDWLSFDLEVCDVLAINLEGSGRQVLIRGPAGELAVASSQDLTGVFPPGSPLPGGGEAVATLVAPAAGRYVLRVLGGGGADYRLELRLFRPPDTPSVPKTLFVDFDGATVDPVIFQGPAGDTTLSPLSSFLSRWGLGPADEDAVIDAVLASLAESLQVDPAQQGPNGAFGFRLLNSRDHRGPFGAPNVSRLIVGGSIAELGIPTIGIAQSIDPGDFGGEETGVILLDLLSGSPPDPNSLNSIPLAAGATIVDLIGVALGNIAAHEAGHFLGSFHTEPFDALANLMDQGGNLPNTLGLGPDGIFGSTDDEDVDFGRNLFSVTERFAGDEDTLTNVACAMTVQPEVFGDGFESGDLSRWSSSLP